MAEIKKHFCLCCKKDISENFIGSRKFCINCSNYNLFLRQKIYSLRRLLKQNGYYKGRLWYKIRPKDNLNNLYIV